MDQRDIAELAGSEAVEDAANSEVLGGHLGPANCEGPSTCAGTQTRA